MATIIAYLVAAAVAALVLSLPFGKTRVGSLLRRIAAFCAILVLVPAIVVSIVRVPPSDGGSGMSDVGCGVESLLALVVLSLVAWAFLFIRNWLARGRDRQRTPMMRRYRHRADNDLLEFLDRFTNGDRDA
ncbi:MAG: hypothetical protein WC538_03820 [Thermoanaerobaculia bacterium]|jgi:hypothetical protein